SQHGWSVDKADGPIPALLRSVGAHTLRSVCSSLVPLLVLGWCSLFYQISRSCFAGLFSNKLHLYLIDEIAHKVQRVITFVEIWRCFDVISCSGKLTRTRGIP